MTASWLAAGYGTSSWDLLWVLFVLLLMIGGIILLLRFVGKRNRGWWMNRSLRSLGGLTLGANKSMQIVEWNNRIYVLGVGEDVVLLESITDPDIVSSLLVEHDVANQESRRTVPAWLQQLLDRRKQATGMSEAAAPSPATPSFEQTLETRLRQLSERRQRVDQMMTDSRAEDRTEEP